MNEDLEEYLVKHRARNPHIQDYQLVETNPSGRPNNASHNPRKSNSGNSSLEQAIDFSNQEESESEQESDSVELN